MLLWVWLAERFKQPLGWAALAQVWTLPFLIWLRVGYDAETSRWTTWAILTLLLAKPMSMYPKAHVLCDMLGFSHGF